MIKEIWNEVKNEVIDELEAEGSIKSSTADQIRKRSMDNLADARDVKKLQKQVEKLTYTVEALMSYLDIETDLPLR